MSIQSKFNNWVKKRKKAARIAFIRNQGVLSQQSIPARKRHRATRGRRGYDGTMRLGSWG